MGVPKDASILAGSHDGIDPDLLKLESSNLVQMGLDPDSYLGLKGGVDDSEDGQSKEVVGKLVETLDEVFPVDIVPLPSSASLFDLFQLIVANKVGSVNLHGYGLTGHVFSILAHGLEDNQSVEKLYLGSNGITDSGATELASVLFRNRTISTLSLSNNGISHLGSNVLSRMLLGKTKRNKYGSVQDQSPSIASYYMNSNLIGDKGCEALSHVLALDQRLRSVDIRDNEIGDIGAYHLASGLMDDATKIRFLDLRNNRIGSDGGQVLGNMLCKNPCLEVLLLGGNQIGDHGVDILLDGLLENDGVLVELDIRNNNITELACVQIAETMANDSFRVEKLYLGGNPLGVGLEVIAEKGIVKTTSLNELDISNVDADDVGIVALCTALWENRRCGLVSLHVDENKFTDVGGAALGEVLLFNNRLKQLTMLCNTIGNETMLKVSSSLQKNPHCFLEMLDIRECTGIDSEGMAALATALETNASLKFVLAEKESYGEDEDLHAKVQNELKNNKGVVTRARKYRDSTLKMGVTCALDAMMNPQVPSFAQNKLLQTVRTNSMACIPGRLDLEEIVKLSENDSKKRYDARSKENAPMDRLKQLSQLDTTDDPSSAPKKRTLKPRPSKRGNMRGSDRSLIQADDSAGASVNLESAQLESALSMYSIPPFSDQASVADPEDPDAKITAGDGTTSPGEGDKKSAGSEAQDKKAVDGDIGDASPEPVDAEEAEEVPEETADTGDADAGGEGSNDENDNSAGKGEGEDSNEAGGGAADDQAGEGNDEDGDGHDDGEEGGEDENPDEGEGEEGDDGEDDVEEKEGSNADGEGDDENREEGGEEDREEGEEEPDELTQEAQIKQYFVELLDVWRTTIEKKIEADNPLDALKLEAVTYRRCSKRIRPLFDKLDSGSLDASDVAQLFRIIDLLRTQEWVLANESYLRWRQTHAGIDGASIDKGYPFAETTDETQEADYVDAVLRLITFDQARTSGHKSAIREATRITAPRRKSKHRSGRKARSKSPRKSKSPRRRAGGVRPGPMTHPPVHSHMGHGPVPIAPSKEKAKAAYAPGEGSPKHRGRRLVPGSKKPNGKTPKAPASKDERILFLDALTTRIENTAYMEMVKIQKKNKAQEPAKPKPVADKVVYVKRCIWCKKNEGTPDFFVPAKVGNPTGIGDFCSWECAKGWSQENQPMQKRWVTAILIDKLAGRVVLEVPKGQGGPVIPSWKSIKKKREKEYERAKLIEDSLNRMDAADEPSDSNGIPEEIHPRPPTEGSARPSTRGSRAARIQRDSVGSEGSLDELEKEKPNSAPTRPPTGPKAYLQKYFDTSKWEFYQPLKTATGQRLLEEERATPTFEWDF